MNAHASRLAMLLALLLGACAAGPPPVMYGGDPLDPAAAPGREAAPAPQAAPEHDPPPAGHGHQGHGSDQAPDGPGDAAAAYTCPMHPQVRQPAPGMCPICGMALVKAETQR